MRYNKILEKNRREIVLLKSFPCNYGKCYFCNYIKDNSIDENSINRVNFEVLNNITGEFGVLEVINSGSVFELPKKTLDKIGEIVKRKNISILYFESSFEYMNRLDEIRNYFKNISQNIEIRFRIGVETFDDDFRINIYGKNFKINNFILEKLKKEFYSVCLLVCTRGLTREMISNDIEIGLNNFRQITINIFIDNNTKVKQDRELVDWIII